MRVEGAYVIRELGDSVVTEALAGGAVIGDGAASGLVAADRELDRAHAEGVDDIGERVVVDAVNPRCSAVGGDVAGAFGEGAATRAVAGFEHEHALARLGEKACRGEPGDSGADHDRVEECCGGVDGGRASEVGHEVTVATWCRVRRTLTFI